MFVCVCVSVKINQPVLINVIMLQNCQLTCQGSAGASWIYHVTFSLYWKKASKLWTHGSECEETDSLGASFVSAKADVYDPEEPRESITSMLIIQML